MSLRCSHPKLGMAITTFTCKPRHVGERRTTDTDVLRRCVYFLDPDKIVPPAAPAPPAPVIQRPRTSSFSQAEQDPVILEPPVTNNPLLFRPNLPAADIATIRRLSARVNVLPVISRADLLSNERLSAIKLAVRRDLADSGIGFGIFDLDNNANNNYRPDEPPTELTNGHHAPNGVPLSSRSGSPVPPSLLRLPYALISPDMYSHSDGVPKIQPSRHDLVLQYTPSYKASSSKLVRGKFIRSYRWGFLDVLDVNHSDFVPLRTAIFHHMEVRGRIGFFDAQILMVSFLVADPPAIYQGLPFRQI